MNFALWTYTHLVNVFSWLQQLFNVNMSTRNLRASYTVGFKLKVIEEAEKTGNRSAGRVFRTTCDLYPVIFSFLKNSLQFWGCDLYNSATYNPENTVLLTFYTN